MGFKFGMGKSVLDGREIFDKSNIELTMYGRVQDKIEGISNFSKNYGLDFMGMDVEPHRTSS